MLTEREIKKVIEILEVWPNRMGCVLVPSSRGKHGYKALPWGWSGKRFGNFDYAYLQDLLKNHDAALLCPVTAVGMMRGAKDFQDHMSAYQAIRATFAMIQHISVEQAQIQYNTLLKTNAKKLAVLLVEHLREKELSA